MIEPENRLKELTGKIRQRGCRLTPQRMAVLKILASNEGHPSAEQIYDRVKGDFPMTSLGTIYKTINLLKEMGEILELGFGNGSNRYDGNNPFPHPHLICIHCEQIVDLQVSSLVDMPQIAAEQTGYRIVDHRLNFFGICPDCQKRGD